jgi:pimeloyl-ACP methyl ester carboxylesterase
MALPLLSDAEIAALSMPTLLNVGARDPLLPSAKTAARLGRLVPRLETIWLPDAGHVLVGHADKVLAFLLGNEPVVATTAG